MFSKACKYGIKSAIYIAAKSYEGKKVGIKEIAEAVNSPSAFTAKILQNLVRQDVLNSTKGPNGGFFIPKEKLDEVKLSHVVDAIDGDQLYVECGLGLKKCSAVNPCPIHHRFKGVRDSIQAMLEETSMLDLSRGIKSQDTYLKIFE